MPDPIDPVKALLVGVAPTTLGDLEFQVRAQRSYLVVRYSGQVSDLETAEAWLGLLDKRLSDAGLSLILWDSRPARGHPPHVRDRIWAWLEEARVLKRSAILVESQMLKLSANLSALGGRLRLRAFNDFDAAEAWLTGGTPPT